MSDPQELLEVVDESGKILRLERRDVIHRDGLLHRDVLVWFWNDKGEILFNRRAQCKDTNPGKLGASVGGHPNPGESTIACALREVEEETGLLLTERDMVPLEPSIIFNKDSTGTLSNHYRASFAYRFNGELGTLRPDPLETECFEWWSLKQLADLNPAELQQFGSIIKNPIIQKELAAVHTLVSL